jgi:sortase A
MKLRKFNSFLSIVVITLGVYIMVAPFLPQIEFWFRDKSPESAAPYSGELATSIESTTTNPAPAENRIVIPSIGLNEPIVESPNINAITNGGTWHRPNSAIPTKDDNTVIVGHRYYGNNTSTFYHLDKVQVGQLLAIYWEGKEILYEVTETKTVDPSAVDIEASTSEKQLTLYTCTPIWTARNRLVVIAKPVDQNSDKLSGVEQ